MKHFIKFILVAVLTALLLTGCSYTRETVRHRDDFFRPVTVLPQRSRPTLSSKEMGQLKTQLESATQVATTLHDSLASLQQYAGSLLTTTRALVDKVSELEAKEYLTMNRQSDLEKSIAQLQIENKLLSQQLADLERKVITGTMGQSPVFVPAPVPPNLRIQYDEALSLFHQKQYEEAITLFSELIRKGIEEDLIDNCEYWIGECRFALKEFNPAIDLFQKVLAMSSSNKKEDAYYMTGRSYEALRDREKARLAYEELITYYPMSKHARTARIRAERLK